MKHNAEQPPPTVAARGGAIASARSSPLWAVLALTWVTSFSAVTAMTGVYFLTEHSYGFSATENVLLALLLGVSYTAGTVTVSRGMRVLKLALPGISMRATLAGLIVLLAALCAVPALIQSRWAVWVFIGCYAPVTGWVWPTVEAFLAAGRSGADLRFATGRFNVSWASAGILSAWALAPLLGHPQAVFGGLIGLHLLGAAFVAWFAPEAAPHGPAGADDSVDHVSPQKAAQLLRAFRCSLLASYAMLAALSALLPFLMTKLGTPTAAKTPLWSVLLLTRLMAFAVLERWHGWHGKWKTWLWSTALAIGSCLACLFAANVQALGLALGALGVSFGAIYAAALYYALEAGTPDVDAGGKHESFIGFGYILGPAIAYGAMLLLA